MFSVRQRVKKRFQNRYSTLSPYSVENYKPKIDTGLSGIPAGEIMSFVKSRGIEHANKIIYHLFYDTMLFGGECDVPSGGPDYYWWPRKRPIK